MPPAVQCLVPFSANTNPFISCYKKNKSLLPAPGMHNLGKCQFTEHSQRGPRPHQPAVRVLQLSADIADGIEFETSGGQEYESNRLGPRPESGESIPEGLRRLLDQTRQTIEDGIQRVTCLSVDGRAGTVRSGAVRSRRGEERQRRVRGNKTALVLLTLSFLTFPADARIKCSHTAKLGPRSKLHNPCPANGACKGFAMSNISALTCGGDDLING